MHITRVHIIIIIFIIIFFFSSEEKRKMPAQTSHDNNQSTRNVFPLLNIDVLLSRRFFHFIN
ncbi:hypothetical protein ABFS83_03G087100 [Erythranthe nasuta]